MASTPSTTASQLKSSKLDLVVAGTENAVLMVESEADQLSEEIMLGGVVYGHQQMQAVINAIHELVKDAGKPDWDWQAPAKDEALIAAVTAAAQEGLNAAYQIREKQARTTKLREVSADVSAKLLPPPPKRAKRRRTPLLSTTSCSRWNPPSCAARS